MLRFLCLFAAIWAVAQGYSKGAPVEVCQDLLPQHPADPQEGPAPYSIFIDRNVIQPGDHVKVTLEGKNGEKFKGFIVQARVGDTIVGSFDVSGDSNVHTIDCPNGAKNAATHSNSDDKNKVSVIWNAPKDLQEVVVFKATFVQNGHVFWVGETSSSLTVSQ